MGWPKIWISIISVKEICVAVDDRCNNSLMWWIVAAVGWEMWKSRNDLVFSNIIDLLLLNLPSRWLTKLMVS